MSLSHRLLAVLRAHRTLLASMDISSIAVSSIAVSSIAIAACLLGTRPAEAQVYTLRVPDVVAGVGQDALFPVFLENDTAVTVGSAGLSFGICGDAALVTPTALVPSAVLDALNGGSGPGFLQVELYPDGWAVGTVYNLLGQENLLIGPADTIEIFTGEGSLAAPVGTTIPLTLCETLGSPPIGIVVVDDTGTSLDPTLVHGSIEVVDPLDPVLRLPEFLSIPATSTRTLPVTLTSFEPVAAFRFGVAAPSGFAISGATPGATLAATNGGSGPDLFLVDTALGVPGCTIECTISTVAPFDALPASPELELVTLTLFAGSGVGPACAEAPITFATTLGAPPVPVELEIAGGGTIVPLVEDGTLVVASLDPLPPTGGITLSTVDRLVSPGASATLPVLLDTDVPVEALSFGIAYDATDVTLDAIDLGSSLTAIRCGAGPEYVATQILPGTPAGATCATVFELQPPFVERTLPAGSEQELFTLTFVTSPAPVGSGTAVTFTDTIGSPPVAIEFTVAGAATPATSLEHGSLGFGVGFSRGDCNDSGALDIADPIFLLSALFVFGELPPCWSACDGNDDGVANIADAVFLLSYLFVPGAPPLSAPLFCGPDPTPDAATCDAVSTCP